MGGDSYSTWSVSSVTDSRRPPDASEQAPKDDSAAKETEGFVVALGASAGGLKAIGDLLSGLPEDFGAPIVAVLHLDPDHLSQLASLLQRETSLRVEVAESGTELEAGSVYVAPPDRHLEVHDGKIKLTRGARVHFSRPSIDKLFGSVARSYGDRSIGVILSGTGGDGATGVAGIKSEGGLVIAQDPETAEFAAMPEAAIATGRVDATLAVGDIPGMLVQAVAQGEAPGALPLEWPQVLAALEKRFGTDFRGYRHTTLKRRLDRRILATRKDDVKEYLQLLQDDEEELERLHAEFLIKVSQFFRDPAQWAELDKTVVRPLVRDGSDTDEIRAWSAGCATGEEAYSLAILLTEAFEDSDRPARFRVYATDLDEEALAAARRGVFSEAQLAGLSPERRQKHFHEDGDEWRVRKELRKRVIFGRHDLLRDPPLASMDLLSCRNVLIYFKPEKAKALLRKLANSVKPRGYLFLGRSEGLRQASSGLKRIHETARIYRRTAAAPPKEAATDPKSRPKKARPYAIPAAPYPFAFGTLVLEATTVIAFGVDARQRIAVWNEAAAGFFDVRPGDAMGRPASEVIVEEFWEALQAAVDQAAEDDEPVGEKRLDYMSPDGPRRYVDLEWIHVNEGKEDQQQGILFLGVDATDRHDPDAEPDGDAPARRTRHQSSEADGDVRAANLGLKALNERLQSKSQEFQTLNEELESRNEELATVNEELQSLNEELNTLNEEVGARIAESERLTAFLRTILDLAPHSVIGCDENDRVNFWNAVARDEFRLSEEQAVGKDLFDLVPVLDVDSVRELVGSNGDADKVQIPREPGRKGSLFVRMGAVYDRAERRQGYVLRVWGSAE